MWTSAFTTKQAGKQALQYSMRSEMQKLHNVPREDEKADSGL